MIIDLVNIPEEGLEINEEVHFPEEDLKKRGIQRLEDTFAKGKIYIDAADEVMMDVHLTGKMILLDAIDASEIEYPLDIVIKENLTDNDELTIKNPQNTLDIMSILWQNIVLEVPIRVTKRDGEDISLHGDGWEFVSQEAKKVDPRLEPLLDLLKEGKE